VCRNLGMVAGTERVRILQAKKEKDATGPQREDGLREFRTISLMNGRSGGVPSTL